jgi:hypothetical protein
VPRKEKPLNFRVITKSRFLLRMIRVPDREDEYRAALVYVIENTP